MPTEDRRAVTQDLGSIPPAELRSYHAVIAERLGIDCTHDPDPVIDLKDIARLAGLADSTPGQMRQRSKNGEGRVPFPPEAPNIGTRWPEKPLFRAVSDVIPYLKETGHWPPGAGARPKTRVPRKAA